MKTSTVKNVIKSFIENPMKEIKTANGSLSVKGGVLYAYQTPLAVIRNGDKVHMNSDRYSVTTSRHQNLLIAEVGGENVVQMTERSLRDELV